MLCQNCNKNSATIHLTEIVNGQRHEKHLCEDCANMEGVSLKAQIPLNELLSNLLSVQPQDKARMQKNASLSCPNCEITMSQINDQSLLGCPEDYQVFEEDLEKVIEKTQDGSTFHCGKVPLHAEENARKQMELLALQKELDAAVRDERYEEAAQLRDKIKLLQ